MKKNPQIFWTIVMLVVGGLAWAGFSFLGDKDGGTVNNIIDNVVGTKTEEVVPLGEGESVETNFTDKTYKHSILGFSFSYQKDFNISSFGNYFDSAGQTILLQKEGGSDGLQVLITPFDEDIALTASRIKKDIPKLNVTNAVEQSLGTGDVKTQIVVFSSTNNLSTGPTLEGWFVYRGNLYQISAQLGSKELFEKIISSWKLQE